MTFGFGAATAVSGSALPCNAAASGSTLAGDTPGGVGASDANIASNVAGGSYRNSATRLVRYTGGCT